MHTLKYLLLLLLSVSLLACKRKKSGPSIIKPDTYADYTKLKPGNYWIYAEYMTDTGGINEATGVTDSAYVSKDTVINENTYHVLVHATLGTKQVSYLRDSLHYLVNEQGNILFSSRDFTNVFRQFYYISPQVGPQDSVALVSEYMSYKDAPVLVPAGIFKTSTFLREYEMHPFYSAFGKRRYYSYVYAENVGLIFETEGWYSSLYRTYEKRLVRYHVE